MQDLALFDEISNGTRDSLAKELFILTPAVQLCCVEKGDAEIKGLVDCVQSRSFVTCTVEGRYPIAPYPIVDTVSP